MPVTLDRSRNVTAAVQKHDHPRWVGSRRGCPFCLYPIRIYPLHNNVGWYFVTRRQAIQPLPATGKVSRPRAIGQHRPYGG
jgi:hypothetical protein